LFTFVTLVINIFSVTTILIKFILLPLRRFNQCKKNYVYYIESIPFIEQNCKKILLKMFRSKESQPFQFKIFNKNQQNISHTSRLDLNGDGELLEKIT